MALNCANLLSSNKTYLFQQLRLFSSVNMRLLRSFNDSEDTPKKKKKAFEAEINLIGPNKSMTVMTLSGAEKLAKRRNLLLNLVENPPKYMKIGDRVPYEMITLERAKYLADKEEGKIESFKSYRISSKIMDHDLTVKINQIKKNLRKNLKVDVVIDKKDHDVDAFVKKLTASLADCIASPPTTNMKGQSCHVFFSPLSQPRETSEKEEKI